MAVRDKAQFPTPGCIVEFLHGNSPTIAYVMDAQADRVRLYTQNKKEMKLPPSRLLPWYGPAASPSLNRAEIESLIEKHRAIRARLQADLDISEIWQLAEGEISRASAGWFSSLVWDEPDIDSEAAMGRALLENKTHFKFSPPEFEIFPLEVAEKRMVEAKANQLRESLALHGNKFFLKLWDVHLGKSPLTPNDVPEPDMALQLEQSLHSAMADAESDDGLWTLLARGLPADPHLALHLATAWGIVPAHYNFLLNKAGYNGSPNWAASYANEIQTLQNAVQQELTRQLSDKPDSSAPALRITAPFVTVDPESTIDRDDAFFVTQQENGSFTLHIAIACPSLFWPFSSPFDKEVLRRATSLYLPEGDLHMLPGQAGCSLFGLDAGKERMGLITSIEISPEGETLNTSLAIQPVKIAANMSHCEAEALINRAAASPEQTDPMADPEHIHQANSDPVQTNAAESEQAMFDLYNSAGVPACEYPQRYCADEIPEGLLAHAPMLAAAHRLACILRAKRLANGAVILERPDTDIWLTDQSGHPLTGNASNCEFTSGHSAAAIGTFYGSGNVKTAQQPNHDQILVQLSQAPAVPKAHLVVGELMIAANAAMGNWGKERGIPLLYRNQDIALPPEYAAVWDQPQDVARIVRSLPPSTVETQPRRHAGLGISGYSTCTSPIRRYSDLLNQGQITSFLTTGAPHYTTEELNALLPLLQARLDAVGQVQRFRPRYWKLLFFRQQGDKQWWPGIATEENNAFVSVSLPWAQIIVRGRRKLFDEKIAPGAHVMVRIGKVQPLLNEIVVLEAHEE